MKTIASPEELTDIVGIDLGYSDWLTIDQERVNRFADATGDHQWIHVDVARAQEHSPFGGPVAHGYLSLSLLPVLAAQIFRFNGARLLVNYGSNKVRFITPVLVGSRVRLRSVISDVTTATDGSFQVTVNHTLAIEDVEKPAVAAETLTRVYY